MATWTSKVDYTDKILAADFNALQTLKADIQKKTVANMGALDSGEFGLETDTRRVFIGSSMGNQVIKGDYITPEMYGAKGDGVTDDTTALQACIDAAELINGEIRLTLPRYRFTHLDIESRITVKGKGRGGSEAADGSGSVLEKIANGIGLTVHDGANYTHLEGFELYGNVGGDTGDGIRIGEATVTNGAGGVTLRDVRVRGMGGDGISVYNGNCGIMDGVASESNGGHGIKLCSEHSSADNVNAWRLNGVTASLNAADGFHIDKSHSHFMWGIVAEGNGNHGIWNDGAYNFIVGYVEQNDTDDANGFQVESEMGSMHSVYFIRGAKKTNQLSIFHNLTWIYCDSMDGTGYDPKLTEDGTFYPWKLSVRDAAYFAATLNLQATVSLFGKFNLGNPQGNDTLGTAAEAIIYGPNYINTTPEVLLRLNRGTRAGDYYNGSVDFLLSAFGAPSGFLPQTELDIKLKAAANYNQTADALVLALLANGNVGIGTNTFGTSAAKVLAQSTGIAPSTSPADAFQLYSKDAGAVAGQAGPHFRTEGGGVLGLRSDTGTTLQYVYQKDDLADDGTVTLPDATSGMVLVSCNGEAGMWLVQADGTVTKISGSTNTANTDADGSLCVYDGGTGAIVKNRLNATGEIRIVYYYN